MRTWLPFFSVSLLAACNGGGGDGDTSGSSSDPSTSSASTTSDPSTTAGPSSTTDSGSSPPTSEPDPTTTADPSSTTSDPSTSTSTTTTDSSSSADDTTSGTTADDTTGGVLGEAWVTYLGGSAFEHARDVGYDVAGNLYTAGGTASPEFPHTLGGPVGNVDVFVAKYDPTGVLLWAHRFGGPNYDRAYALEVTPDGGVVLAGRAGMGLPTTNGALQPAFAGDMDAANLYGQQDGFVAKLDGDGGLTWLTYFGGPGRDFIRDIAVDGDGDLYVAASQVTRDHPHVSNGAFDTSRSGMDCVAAKLDGDGGGVQWAGYLGGTGDDCPEPAIRVDASESPAMVISTDADDLPDSPGAFQSARAGDYDLFVARVAPDGASLAFGTYFGGSNGDGLETHNLGMGADGRVYLGAVTLSDDLPTTPGAFQPSYGGTGGNGTGQNTNYPGDGFLAILSADGTTLEHCTYLGGSVGDAVEGVSVAADGRVFLAGGTFSADFPATADAYQGAHGGELDGFLAVFAPDLSDLEYASFIGGSGWDVLRSAEVGPGLRIAGPGETRSGDLPVTANAADMSFGGGNEFDAVVAQLLPALP